MINTIVIDDEAFVREEVKQKIKSFYSNQITVVAEAGNIKDAINAIENHKPDLLFLDVHLKEGTSFDILNAVTYKGFEVIFVTGYDNHAITAIKVGALDYVLKPIDDDEFKEAVDKAIENSVKENHLEKLIAVSSDYFKSAEKKRVILKTADSVYAVNEEDILFCKSDGNYTSFFIQNSKTIVVSKPINKIEEIVSKKDFVRCHQSYLVNKNHVSKFDKQGYLILSKEIKVPVSSRRKDYVIDRVFS